MKKILILIGLLSSLAFAGEVNLTPGTEVTLRAHEPTLVKCDGDVLPLCSIRKNNVGDYEVLINGTVADVVAAAQYAVNRITEFKKVGICR
ncbi:MAG: hypothetical protein AB7F43_15015 [Bacteriovoracia bacterium]